MHIGPDGGVEDVRVGDDCLGPFDVFRSERPDFEARRDVGGVSHCEIFAQARRESYYTLEFEVAKRSNLCLFNNSQHSRG